MWVLRIEKEGNKLYCVREYWRKRDIASFKILTHITVELPNYRIRKVKNAHYAESRYSGLYRCRIRQILS